MAPRPPQEAWKGTKIEAKRLPRSNEEDIRTENVETSKMTTLSMKILDFVGSGGRKFANFVSGTASKTRKIGAEVRRSLRKGFGSPKRSPRGPRQVLSMLWGGYVRAPVAPG